MTTASEGVPPLIALTIAGFDPSGGAGVIADIRTFGAFGCFATAAITSLTFQNTRGVFGASHQTAATVRAQIMAIKEDFRVSGVKTGMLPTPEVIRDVALLFREGDLPSPVVDPVMRATSGDDLINDDAISCLVADLFPVAQLVTPNIGEAERLTGLRICDEASMHLAAKTIREMGARAVLVKGGHLGRHKADGSKQKAEEAVGAFQLTSEAIDVLDNDGHVTVFHDQWIDRGEVHGSGCTLSAAIAACLGSGMSMEEAIQAAKSFVTDAIRRSPALGHGARPLFVDTRHLTPGPTPDT
jgi:hydroxymethylpyrimidine/phosphomethylpyrimidine kinase